MKRIFLTTMLLAVGLSAQAGGFHHHGHHPFHGGGPGFSIYLGGYPSYNSPWRLSYSYPVYPSYAYSPGYGYDYSYSRPNYAVNGVLSGALLGGLIGNSINHQGWEGAGIGAAAGLVFGGLAEANARSYERSYVAPSYVAPPYVAPPVYRNYSQPNSIPNAPTINNAPTIPDAPRIPSPKTYRPAGAMSGANRLFGR